MDWKKSLRREGRVLGLNKFGFEFCKRKINPNIFAMRVESLWSTSLLRSIIEKRQKIQNSIIRKYFSFPPNYTPKLFSSNFHLWNIHFITVISGWCCSVLHNQFTLFAFSIQHCWEPTLLWAYTTISIIM